MKSVRSDRWKVLAIFLAGIVITLAFARAYYNTAELRTRQLELVLSSGQELTDIFEAELQSAIGLIQSTTWLFYASDHISRSEFSRFTSRALNKSELLEEIHWRPHVRHSMRKQFVAEARMAGLVDYDLLDYDESTGKFVPAGIRAEYYPILYAEPVKNNQFGFDSASDFQKRQDMVIAASTGQPIATKLLPYQNANDGSQAIIIYVPIYQMGSGDDYVLGFISGLIRLDILLKKIEQKAKNLGVDFMLFDVTATPELIYYGAGITKQFSSGQISYEELDSTQDYKLPLNFAGREWQFVVHPDIKKIGGNFDSLYGILLFGLFLSVLLAYLASLLFRERRALINTEQKLTDITGNLPVGVFQVMFKGESHRSTTFVNERAASFVGVSIDDMLNHLEASFKNILPEDQLMISESLEHARRTRRVWEQEFRVQLNGQINWLYTRAVPREGPNGSLYLNGYLEDITERKRVEQELRNLNIFQQTMIDTIPNAIFYKDSDGKFLGCNRAYEEAFGTTRDYLIGKTVLDLEYLPKADRLAYQAEDMRLINEVATAHHDIPMQFADGKDHQVLYWVSGFQLSDGSPGGLVGVIVDITAQTEAQEALQVSIAEQEAIFNSAPLGIALFRNRIMASSNQRWEQIIGYSQQEMVGQSNKAWFLDEESHGLLGRLAYPLMGRGETYRGEWLLKRKDGSQFWCRMSGHAIDPEDAIGGSVWQFEDITAERDAAEELMKAKDIAEEATHAKSMFLANMSHEIRTPLNAIIGLAHLTLKTSLSVKQHDYVSKMHNAGVSLLSIINDILDFSKIEAGRIDLENTQFSLDEVVDHLTTGLGTASMENKLEILFDISADVPALVMGDKLRLGQVLLNLVGNAVKFTEQGEVIVRAESLERTNDRIKLLFTVNDTGIGMSPAEVSKLFQPFTQADCTTTRKYGGTGLGLTISKRLVELMGGNIWVNSEMGKGSTFSFTAWFGLAENKRRARLVPEELNGLKVLIVDDNVAARTILAGQLAFLPLEIDQVTSGQEAIEAVNQSQSSKPIDLILMDWNMPRLNGMETARKIKQDQSLKKIPLIIMVTAFGHDDVRREAEALNLDGFLIKPVNQSTLVDMLVTLYAPSSNAVVNRRKGDQHAATYDLSSMRILVVEDNEINQQIARELLESVGANVEVASDGRECVDKLMHQDKKYDVVLMDLQMPVMDGYAATIMIRQNPDLAQLPIIAMTAHAAADARERCLEVGMNGHVAKPIDPDVLYQTLSHYMPNTDKVSPRNTAKKAKAKPIADDAILNLLNGIDVATGLKRVAGNQKLYISLLEQFVSGYADSDKQILLALESNKRDDAQRLAHSVKGVAGNIGANALSQSAAEIERILREGGEHHQAVLGYQKELKKTLKIINKAISKQSVKKRLTGQGDVGKVETKLKILLKYVKSSDARSQDYWVEHQDVFEQHLASESYETLRQAIHGFDFEVAHDEIEVILASQSGTK